MREVVAFAGRRVFAADDGRLHLSVDGANPRALDPERPVGLLALLEEDRGAYDPAALAELPLRALLLLAVTTSDYWAALAVEDWLTPADLDDAALREAVRALAADERRPRLVRTGARRLLAPA